jgi:serine/tyrosine/threonine adenylyltransferase
MPLCFDTTYKDLDSKLYSIVGPKDIDNPEMLVLNENLCDDLGLDKDELNNQVLSGQELLEEPIAQAYAGHQFGRFTVLGDGRAMILGEHVHDGSRYDIQLKGSGRTPYSRRGDGNATVSSMLREYIYSYAMQNLRIKTSRSLAVIETEESVQRRRTESGAILVRVMNSHIRYGTFQYVATQAPGELEGFTDYVINRHYPHLNNKDKKYVDFFDEVMQSSIDMVVDWMRVGFIHGVMNTDNMSVDGETFDYGPCAFMNYYDEDTVFSSVDKRGRYSFGNQKDILQWNLTRFAESLQPLFDESSYAFRELKAKLDNFEKIFDAKYYNMMSKKLGIDSDEEKEIINKFLDWLRRSRADYTNTFIELENPGSFDHPVYSSANFKHIRDELASIGLDERMMKKANPRYVPRNYLIEETLNEYLEKDDLSKFESLLNVLENPYESKDTQSQFQQPPPEEFDSEYTTYCNT